MKTYISALLLAGITFTAISCDRNNDTQIVNDQDTIGQEYKILCISVYLPMAVILAITSLSKSLSPKYLRFNL